MRRTLASMVVGMILVFGVAACDDAPADSSKMDEDDGRVGPGDGVDETGPGR